MLRYTERSSNLSLRISSQHNNKKNVWCVYMNKMRNSCTIHLHVKLKGMLLRFLFTLPFFRHMLEGYRVSEEHKKYIHLCIHIIKWKGCSDQKFMTSFSRVVVTLICFVVFFPSILSIVLTRSPTCMFLSLSSLPPFPPFFIIIIEKTWITRKCIFLQICFHSALPVNHQTRRLGNSWRKYMYWGIKISVCQYFP